MDSIDTGDERLREASTPALVRELFGGVQQMLREEVRLAKSEAKAEAARAAKAGAGFGAGAVLAHTALLCLAATLILIGSTFMKPWLAALVVLLLFAGAAVAAIKFGQKKLASVDPARPVERLKEDGRWARETMQSIRSTRHANA